MANTKDVSVKDTELKDNAQAVVEAKKASKEVDTKLGTSPEEKAAERAEVQEERLENPVQNREPKNEFEKDNQKVTEVERVAAQKVSDMSTKERVENSETPNEIAAAIAEGFKRSKEDQFTLEADPGVDPRFTLVKNKETGEVMIRENETGTLSKVQLLSIEEKEADVQNTKVEEL